MTVRTKAVLGILGVFVLGGVCGALVLGIVVRDRVRETRNLREREGFARFFFDKLQLSDAQNDSLRGVLDSTYRELEQLRVESSQRYAEVIDHMRSRVYPKLSPEQRVLFEEQEQRIRAMVPPPARPLRDMRNNAALRPPVPTSQPTIPTPQSQQTPSAPLAALTTPQRPDTTPRMRGERRRADTTRPTGQGGTRSGTGELGLNDSQKQQIRAILREQKGKMQEMMAGDAPPMEKVRLRRQIRREGIDRVLNILTPEQRQQVEQMRSEGRRPRWWKELSIDGSAGNGID